MLQDSVYSASHHSNILIKMESHISHHSSVATGELQFLSNGIYPSFIWAAIIISVFCYTVNYCTPDKSKAALHSRIPKGPSGLPIAGKLLKSLIPSTLN